MTRPPRAQPSWQEVRPEEEQRAPLARIFAASVRTKPENWKEVVKYVVADSKPCPSKVAAGALIDHLGPKPKWVRSL